MTLLNFSAFQSIYSYVQNVTMLWQLRVP